VTDLVLEYVGDHPGYVPRVLAHNTLRLLELEGWEREKLGAKETGVGPAFSVAGRVAFWVVALLAVGGLAAARRTPWFVWAVPLLLVAALLPVLTAARYRSPADPFLLVLAGATLSRSIPHTSSATRLVKNARR
jgi:hypothetical protein